MSEIIIDRATLNNYKDLYNGHNIIYVRFLDEEFIFRTLTRKEYKYIISNGLNRYDIEDTICSVCCLYPEEYDFANCGYAGLNEYVASLIEYYSNFTDISTVMQTYKNYKEDNSLETQCMNLIKAFIPEYTYEEMEEWTWDKLMKITARAEAVCKLKGFNWELQDTSEDYKKQFESISIDNKEIVDNLIKNGIDPMMYFSDTFRTTFNHDIIEYPIITEAKWNDEAIINATRKQIRKKKIK